MNIQLKKGVLELCVLSMLIKRDYYGYELVEHISEYIDISEGTIYPLLKRLKDGSYVNNYLAESQEGPPRKYYRITEEGKETFNKLEEEWSHFINGVNELIRGNFHE